MAIENKGDWMAHCIQSMFQNLDAERATRTLSVQVIDVQCRYTLDGSDLDLVRVRV